MHKRAGSPSQSELGGESRRVKATRTEGVPRSLWPRKGIYGQYLIPLKPQSILAEADRLDQGYGTLCHVSHLRRVESRRTGKTKVDGKKARRRCAARRGNARSLLHMFHQIMQ